MNYVPIKWKRVNLLGKDSKDKLWAYDSVNEYEPEDILEHMNTAYYHHNIHKIRITKSRDTGKYKRPEWTIRVVYTDNPGQFQIWRTGFETLKEAKAVSDYLFNTTYRYK